MEKVVSLKVNSKCLKDLPCYEGLEEEHAITVGVFDGVDSNPASLQTP
jgi:riboflavin kinase/FMN adenylyltransferase